MKIMTLRLYNLNSLAGEWLIDFTHPEFQTEGLFAITGPTGVGKTTILDAICLALYGQTPRLEQITQSTNEIMSRGRGECSAELIFETPTGRWRTYWSQHRSRRKADGELQAPRHEIADDLTGKLLATSLSKTKKVVSSITGMDFDQFKRSTLLAQGSFAAFLEAKPKEKADLLEQITGVDIYSDISQKIYERRGRERQLLETWQLELKGLAAPEDDEKTLQGECTTLKNQAEKVEAELATKNGAQAWLAKLHDLEEESRRLQETEKELVTQESDFQPRQLKIDWATKAAKLEGLHSQLNILRRNLSQTETDQQAYLKQLPKAEEAAQKAALLTQKAESQTSEARQAEDEARPQIIQVRSWDGEIKEKEQRQLPLKAELAKWGEQLGQLLKCRTTPISVADFASCADHLATIRVSVAKHRDDFELKQREIQTILEKRDLADWRMEARNLSRQSEALALVVSANQQLLALRAEKADFEKQSQYLWQKLNEVTNNLKRAQDKAADLEKENETLTAQREQQAQMKQLDQWRPQLKTGHPCPLCGSLDHPLADQDSMDQVEEISTEQIKAHKKTIQDQGILINKLTAQESGLKQKLASGQENDQKRAGEMERLVTQIKQTFQTVSPPPENLWSDELAKSQTDQRLRQDQVEKIICRAEELSNELPKMEKDLMRFDQSLATSTQLIGEAQIKLADLAAIETETNNLAEKRHTLFGTKNPEAEEKRLRENRLASEKNLELQRKKLSDLEKEPQRLKILLTETTASITRQTQELKILTDSFLLAAQTAGFADETAWRIATLPEEELAVLKQKAQQLTEKRAGLAARLAA